MFRFLLVAASWFLVTCSSVVGQETKPVDPSSNLFVPLGAEIAHYSLAGIQVRAYEQADKGGNVVVLPWFALKTDTSGKVAVSVVNTQADKAMLTIRLLVVPESSRIKQLLVQEMREQAASQLNPQRKGLFASVTDGKIIPAMTKEIIVSEINYNGPYKFESRVLNDFGGTEIPISVTVPRDEVDSIKREVEEGLRWFEVSFRIYAKAFASESFVEIRHETICKTDALRDIFGDGGAIDPTNLKPSLITRQQKLAIAGSVLKNIAVSYDIQNPLDLAVLEPQVTKYIDSLFTEQDLLLDKSWSLLSLYGFSKKDIEPDEIKAFVKSLRDKVEDHQENEFTFSTSGSASFCGFGGSASISTSGKKLKDHKEEHELALDIKGDIGIPKGLRVYSIDAAKLQTSGMFTTTIRRSYGSLARQSVSLNSGPSSVPVNQLATVEERLAIYQSLPIGCIIAWHKAFEGTPPLPLAGTWVECDGQVLNDTKYADSPYYGKQIPDLNGEARFLRGGGYSGVMQPDEIRSHTHGVNDPGHSHSYHFGNRESSNVNQPSNGRNRERWTGNTNAAHTGISIQHTGGNETRPINMSVVWIIRVR